MPSSYAEILVPVDNSRESDLAVDRAIELAGVNGGRLTGTHVYAARLHDVRFRQLEVGLPAQFQEPAEIRRQRKIHDKLIEKGLQLISDSFLDQTDQRCRAAGVPLRRQLLEGINYEEIVKEANGGEGRLPSLIGFDPNIADKYDGGATVRSDVAIDDRGRLVAEDEEQDEKLAGSSGRDYDLVAIGAHGLGRQPYSQLGGVVARAVRGIRKDVLIVRDDRRLRGGRFLVCIDGSAYSYKCMRVALELAREFGAKLFVCSSFDVEYHHVVFHNIKDVLSVQASKVFKFEEQEELHNNIIDKGLARLAKANLKRATVMAAEFDDVEVETQVLVGKPFQVVLQWAEEIDPTLLILARHGAHRIEGTDMGSQAENLVRLAPCNTLLIGTTDVRPDEIPWIEEDGEKGLEWAPEAEVRIQRVPPFALGIARKAVEEYVLEYYGPGSRYAAAFTPVDRVSPYNNDNGTTSQNHNGTTAEHHNGTTAEHHNGTTAEHHDGTTAEHHDGTTAEHHDSRTAEHPGGKGGGNGKGVGATAAGNGGPLADPEVEPERPGTSGAERGRVTASGGLRREAAAGEVEVEVEVDAGDGIAPRKASGVSKEVLPVVTNERLDEAIQKLLPTHMQLIMGIGTAEELAQAEVKAQEAMKRTVVEGSDADPEPEAPVVETKCPVTGRVGSRPRDERDPVVWTAEAFARLRQVPLIARPLARNTVEKFARTHGYWRVTTMIMDENKQAMIEADEFDLDTMLVMFKELQTKQLKAAAEGVDGLTPEMRKFIEEAKASGVTRCPIRDIEQEAEKCPVDFRLATPEEAKEAVSRFMSDRDRGES